MPRRGGVGGIGSGRWRQPSGRGYFQLWQRVAAALERSNAAEDASLPPERAGGCVDAAEDAYVKQHDGEPGRTVRRLTSGECAPRPRPHGSTTGIDAASDSVGRRGFLFGDVRL